VEKLGIYEGGNDSANTSDQICKAAYTAFHKRGDIFGISQPLHASMK
jgi:hypothetical protein